MAEFERAPVKKKALGPKKQLSLSLAHRRRRDGLPAVSLFSGAGGLDLGIEQAGAGQIKFCSWVESNADCQSTLTANAPHVVQGLFDDVSKVTPKEIMAKACLGPGEAFLVAGGPPCQAFSTAGLRQSVSDQRGQVVEQYFEIIRVLRPRFFVFENVRGLLSVALEHRNYVERMENLRWDPEEKDTPAEKKLGSVFQQVVLKRMSSLGYEVVYGLVDTANYGTAQSRQRVVILGSRDREFGSGNFRKTTGQLMNVTDLLPATHHRFAPYEPIQRWRNLRDGIGHLNNVPLSRDQYISYSDVRASVWRRMPPGTYWTYIRDNPLLFPEGLQALLKGAYESGGGKVGFWRRLSWDKPAPTLPTQPQHLSTSLCHPDHERPLSIPEYAALQDFPSDYRFAGNKSSQYEQIGNAVPLRLGKAIGNLLLAVSAGSGVASSEREDEGAPEADVDLGISRERTRRAS